MTWKFAIAMLSALAFSAPAFATGMTNYAGHHACPSGGKKGGCMTHHYTGHHASPSGDKKSGMMHHYSGHHASPSGDKKSGVTH